MKRTISLFAAMLILAACGKDKADEFRDAIPSADAVKVNVPAKAGQGLSGIGQRQDGLGDGETAEFYKLTRGVTVVINGGTVLVLGLVKAITDQRPTSIKENVAVWGPHTDALSPNTYRMTVTKTGEADYSYVLEGKAKKDADTEFKALLSGSHKVTGDRLGNGTFMLDWNAMQKLPEHGTEVGSAEFIYSHVAAKDDVKIDVAFRQVKDAETGKLIDAYL
jgi:hypothetical protein